MLWGLECAILPSPDQELWILAASLGPQAHPQGLPENGLQIHLPPKHPKMEQNGAQELSKWSPEVIKKTICHETVDIDFGCYLQHFSQLPPKTFGRLYLDPITSKKAFRNAFGIAES
jgi:hypothetical protein